MGMGLPCASKVGLTTGAAIGVDGVGGVTGAGVVVGVVESGGVALGGVTGVVLGCGTVGKSPRADSKALKSGNATGGGCVT